MVAICSPQRKADALRSRQRHRDESFRSDDLAEPVYTMADQIVEAVSTASGCGHTRTYEMPRNACTIGIAIPHRRIKPILRNVGRYAPARDIAMGSPEPRLLIARADHAFDVTIQAQILENFFATTSAIQAWRFC